MAIKKIPCGGFYVDDGAVKNIDGKPVLSAWNADLPKPSVGGYGYTEQGEQTVITWDGDTEGREAIYIEEDGERIDLNYKVSDLTFTADSVLGGKMTFNNVEYDISDINIVNNDSDGYTSSTAEFTAVVLETFAVISCSASGVIRFTEDGETFEYHCPDTGIYFVNAGGNYFVSSLTYGTPDTIHKIDEKYLPSSGSVSKFYINTRTTGGELVDGTLYTDEEMQIEATIEDVKEAIGTNILLYDSYTRDAFIPIECCYTRGYQYGFIIMSANPDDLTQVNTWFFGHIGIH